MKFRIIIYYNNKQSLKSYLDKFQVNCDCLAHCASNFQVISNDYIEIVCVKGLREHQFRGAKAHFIAVQEDLTWREDWEQIRDLFLSSNRMSPIPIHIFDGQDQQKHFLENL